MTVRVCTHIPKGLRDLETSFLTNEGKRLFIMVIPCVCGHSSWHRCLTIIGLINRGQLIDGRGGLLGFLGIRSIEVVEVGAVEGDYSKQGEYHNSTAASLGRGSGGLPDDHDV